MIREARPLDAKAIVDIIVDSFSDKFSVIFGKRIKSGKEALVRYYGQPKTLEGTFVAEVSSDMAGIIHIATNTISHRKGSVRIFGGLGLFGIIRAVLAFIILDHKVEENECYVEHLAVASAFRGRGIGKQLLSRGEEFARKEQKRVYSLYVASDNQFARQLYKSMGFLEVRIKSSIFARLFLGKRTFIFMQKHLPA